MKYVVCYLTVLLLLPLQAMATTAPFDLSISGKNFQVEKKLEIQDIAAGNSELVMDFSDRSGQKYKLEIKYKQLPANRSYPSNLDITVYDSHGNKLGYLFWANNGIEGLQKIGTFGLMFDVDGEPVDVQFRFDAKREGSLSVAALDDERFVQDTLIPKLGFQMIRPVVLPRVSAEMRSITYALDNHPYAVNYTALNKQQGIVEFQFNLLDTAGDTNRLLERIYFTADSIEALREGMFAGKYFDKNAGTIKLVFYPTLGQTSPADAN